VGDPGTSVQLFKPVKHTFRASSVVMIRPKLVGAQRKNMPTECDAPGSLTR